MKKRHVTKNFLDWTDEKLDARQREQIEMHLQNCPDCRTYYEKMSAVFSEKTDLSALPQLEADPFLPARIKALAGKKDRTPSDKWFGWQRIGAIRLAFSTLLIILAASLGIYLGKGLATSQQYSESDLISDYYQAFNQQSYSDNWEYVLEEESGVQQ
jgi:predicted anti-sigma-YlaC factor YlaD